MYRADTARVKGAERLEDAFFSLETAAIVSAGSEASTERERHARSGLLLPDHTDFVAGVQQSLHVHVEPMRRNRRREHVLLRKAGNVEDARGDPRVFVEKAEFVPDLWPQRISVGCANASWSWTLDSPR